MFDSTSQMCLRPAFKHTLATQSMIVTSLIDVWKKPPVKSRFRNTLLNKLSPEIISMILTFVCTSDNNITSCAISNFQYQTEYPLWKNQQRHCDCYRDFRINPFILKTLKDTAAVSLTCRAFYGIVSGDALLYKSNTFEFCTLNDVNRCLQEIPDKKRDAIESIKIHYRFTKFYQDPPVFQRLACITSSAFKATGDCARLKSLTVCPDDIPTILARYHIEIYELPGLKDWVDLRGLHQFQMNIGTTSMSVWAYRAGRRVKFDFSYAISLMEEKIRALITQRRVTDRRDFHSVVFNLDLQRLFAVPKPH